MKVELCYHPEIRPTTWGQKRPEPTVMVGPCDHNMVCPVCGYGRGCYPDPCDEQAGGFSVETLDEGTLAIIDSIIPPEVDHDNATF